MGESNQPSRWDSDWDAGDMGCGELVLFLRQKVLALPSSGVLRLLARDEGAKEDIPAWCRVTGHSLVASEPPFYFIQKKKEEIK